MAWVITQDEVLYLSTEHYLGPHIWSEPGVACWSLENDRVVGRVRGWRGTSRRQWRLSRRFPAGAHFHVP